MAALLSRASTVIVAALLCRTALAADGGDRHRFELTLDLGYQAADSDLGAWTDGGLGKLRYADDDGVEAARVMLEYRGRISPTWSTTIVADYVDDASSGLDLTETFVEWRPIPRSKDQHQVRIGAFYPPLSLENVSAGWESPYSDSYSAINTWIGEEIRPIGAEWSLRRRLGPLGSPHELEVFAAGFFGNDPAGTLLFWRGWSLHARQTRLNDRLPMPQMPQWNSQGTIVGFRDQHVEPFEEIDHDPGVYGGVEWRYARRVLLKLARYDNRADPHAFDAGQWGWHTAFTALGLQASLPWEIGLVAQWLDGSTYWISGARRNGTLSPAAELVEDGFDARFVLLTRSFGGAGAHRLSIRYDDFAMAREPGPEPLSSDHGHAWTAAYRFEPSPRWSARVEWLKVESRRDLWSEFYAKPHAATERHLRLIGTYRLGTALVR
jgi:hypothetical protein